MRFRLALTLWVIGLFGLACDGPTAGELTVELVTPSDSDGAILFKVTPATSKTVTSMVAACSACQVLTYSPDDTEFFGVVVGTLAPGPLVTMSVSDVGAVSAYTLEIIEIAGRDKQPRSRTGHELRIVR